MSAEILVVEDERLVAQDLKEMLQSMGYQVPAVAYSAEEALEKAAWICPDLVLMDIRLDGERDGVEAAVRMRRNLKLPIVYLTAYADDETLDRAKEAEPYGYLVKPYTEVEVRSAVRIALHKAGGEKRQQGEKDRHLAALRCMADGVITIDLTGQVTYMNPAAEALTFGRDLHEVFLGPQTDHIDQRRRSQLLREIATGGVGAGLQMAQGRDDVPIEYCAASLVDQRGETAGSVLVLRDIDGRLAARLADEAKSGARHPAAGIQGLHQAADQVAEEAYNYLSLLDGYDFWIRTHRQTADSPREEIERREQILSAKHRFKDAVGALRGRIEADGKQSNDKESRFATELWQCCTNYIGADERQAEISSRFTGGQLPDGEMKQAYSDLEQAIRARGRAEQVLREVLLVYREIRE